MRRLVYWDLFWDIILLILLILITFYGIINIESKKKEQKIYLLPSQKRAIKGAYIESSIKTKCWQLIKRRITVNVIILLHIFILLRRQMKWLRSIEMSYYGILLSINIKLQYRFDLWIEVISKDNLTYLYFFLCKALVVYKFSINYLLLRYTM